MAAKPKPAFDDTHNALRNILQKYEGSGVSRERYRERTLIA